MNETTDGLGKQILGFATGLAFGALLEKGRLGDQDVILRQLILDDWRVVKTMGSAVAVGGLAVNALAKKGLVEKVIKPLNFGGVLAGGALFGVGLAIGGYCPGTSLAAAGSRKQDAAAGVLGMLLGAGAFVMAYPKIKPFMEVGGRGSKVTLPDILRWKERPREQERDRDTNVFQGESSQGLLQSMEIGL